MSLPSGVSRHLLRMLRCSPVGKAVLLNLFGAATPFFGRGIYPRHKLGRAEGLGHIIVGTA